MNENSPASFLQKIVQAYDAGIICPAEVWNQVADCLNDCDVETVLNNCTKPTRQALVRIYADRPHSLQPEQGPANTRARIETWLQG
ncbi:hypothetical protein AB1L30_14015 [Bremerella sp. JC817]|uniref:hypothetical protein n=1 Tax=Bremerella sp. JC817 TaxID=3231756 RepID=UPI003459B48D